MVLSAEGTGKYGVLKFQHDILVPQFKEEMRCSTLEGSYPSSSRVVHYVHGIIIIIMSPFLKYYLTPLAKWNVIRNVSVWAVCQGVRPIQDF